tara:strand:+ start:1536 stop:4715 length:3180 start_codon:yes stop_codon:yes gene_type:complete
MATYVPGSETYLPDIKPFTPDYKFLSAVLDVRQDKYNTNWQATNDVYNKVVYADLSREDNNDKREQYVNNLAPSLEKIASMDLSLAQNAQSAKAVFAPFFEDKLIVKDMVKTANYRKEMAHADRLETSPDHLVRSMYWRDGVAKLQYDMEDFINMDADSAIKAPLEKYVPKANLHQLSNEILGALEPPLQITDDVPMYNIDGSVNPDWIVTQKNGSLIEGPALQILRKQLANDPRVRASYDTQAYVLGRDFAAEGMQAGKFSTVQEGQSVWAQETIQRIAQNNALILLDQTAKVSDLQNINVRWSNYEENVGIIPGSDDDKLRNEQLSIYEKTKLDMEASQTIENIIKAPSGDLNTQLSTAYQLLMLTNLDGDMRAEAELFSKRDSGSTMRLNPMMTEQRKFKMDLAKISARHQNGMIRDQIKMDEKRKLAYDLARDKGELYDPNDPLSAAANAFTYGVGGGWTTEYEKDEDGNPMPDSDIHAISSMQYQETNGQLKKDKVNNILGSLRIQNPNGELVDGAPTHQWTLNIGGEEHTGSMEYLKNVLSLTDDAGGLVNSADIETIFEQQSKIITGVDEKGNLTLKATDPSLVATQTFIDLNKAMTLTATRQTVADQDYSTALSIHRDAYTLTRATAREDNRIRKFMDDGSMPDIVSPEGNMYSREEYIAHVTSLVESGEVTNVDQWGWDTGTNAKDYITKSFSMVASGRPGHAVKVYDYNPDGSNKMVVDERAVKSEAGEVYDKLYEALNMGLTGNDGEIPTATFKSITLGRNNTPGDLDTNPTYTGNFDPKVRTGEGRALAAQVINQINSMNANGQTPIYIAGDLNDSDWTTNNATAQETIQSWILDVTSTVGNDKSSNSLAQLARAQISYSPVFGRNEEGEVTTAGYNVVLPDGYLASQVKGGAADSKKQYAGLSKDNIDLFSSGTGITILFDQTADVNPRKNQMNWGSPIVSEIMASPTQSVTTYPQDSLGDNTGNYTIQRISDQEYVLNYQYRMYQPGGTYTTSPIRTWNIPTTSGTKSLGEILQNQKMNAEEVFSTKGLENVLAKQKDLAINKNK